MRLRNHRQQRRSRMKWVCAVTAPWALSVGLLVSFTAEAGNTPQSGLSALSREHMNQMTAADAPIMQSDMVLRAYSGNRLIDNTSLALQASLRFRDDNTDDSLGYLPPKGEMKQTGSTFPEVNKSTKIASRYIPESLSRRAIDLRNSSTAVKLAFARDERALPPTVVLSGSLEAEPYDLQTFQLDEDEPDFAIVSSTTTHSPMTAAAGSTGSGVTYSMGDGSSPAVSRAVVLSSSTPAPLDEMPMEIASSVPVSKLGNAGWIDERLQPNYAALIKASNWDAEKKCLAEAVYFEARSESADGQAAVAQVVLNRVKSGLYPSTICGTVYQNRNRYMACQFSFACEGKSLRITEPGPWAQAQKVANSVLEGKTYLADVGGATHYHADYVKPYWSKKLKKMDVIGRHIFYKLRPGQT
ncbi:cell wall hydrolase [Microvirga sp. W0021]|uniref:Cell wall hydrolase n=1 Tax=Hohaiivirga grylli TaxID=3133970 RepID=A0ABV0BIY1_9HYPH